MPKGKKQDKVTLFEHFGFVKEGIRSGSGDLFGKCLFCQRKGKFHVSLKTYQFHCKSADCDKKGNYYSFPQIYYQFLLEDKENYPWHILSRDRAIPIEVLQKHHIAYDKRTLKWILPAFKTPDNVGTLYTYHIGGQVYNMPTGSNYLWGGEKLEAYSGESVWLVEGLWDKICAEEILGKKGKLKELVIGVPGAGEWSDEWKEDLKGKKIVVGYDNDKAGRAGTQKIYMHLGNIRHIKWPEDLPDGFDIRDIYQQPHFANRKFLLSLTRDYEPLPTPSKKSANNKDIIEDAYSSNPVDYYTPLDRKRASLEEVVKVYAKRLFLTPELIDVIRVSYAVVMSNQLPGGKNPLWMFIVGPPSYGKTEVLDSMEQCLSCVHKSIITRQALVSGTPDKNGRDPSLVPKIIDKTLVLKDFTEVLQMPPEHKRETYSVLRGLFDGHVERPFGQHVNRDYRGRCTILAGVTHAILGESNSTVGERFLMYNMSEPPIQIQREIVRAAISNSNTLGEDEIIEKIQTAAKRFLERKISNDNIPTLPEGVANKLTYLASLCARLRTTVEKDTYKDKVNYRPRSEAPNRIAAQLKRLLLALSLQRYPAKITEDDYRIVQKVALDSCVGWKQDLVNVLVKREGLEARELGHLANIPKANVREQIDDSMMLNIVKQEQAGKTFYYYLTEEIKEYWRGAGLDIKESREYLNGQITEMLPTPLRSLETTVTERNGRGKVRVRVKAKA